MSDIESAGSTAAGSNRRLSAEEILKKQNLSIDDLIQCGKKGLSATRIQRDRYGDTIAEDPDYATRHKFFASFLELLGYMKKDAVNVQVVNISAEERELLEAYKQRSVRVTGYAPPGMEGMTPGESLP